MRCSCGNTIAIDEFGDYEGGPFMCRECSDGLQAEGLLALEDGEHFAAELADLAARHACFTDNESQVLIVQANDAFRRGDAAQAQHLLGLAARPKWSSIAECQAAYNAAMGRAE